VLADDLGLEGGYSGFEFEDSAYPGEGEAFADQDANLGDLVDLVTAVAALTALRSGRANHGFPIEAAKKSLLHGKHVRDLADGEHRRSLIVDRQLHRLTPGTLISCHSVSGWLVPRLGNDPAAAPAALVWIMQLPA
jgi:hypothetical protein